MLIKSPAPTPSTQSTIELLIDGKIDSRQMYFLLNSDEKNLFNLDHGYGGFGSVFREETRDKHVSYAFKIDDNIGSESATIADLKQLWILTKAFRDGDIDGIDQSEIKYIICLALIFNRTSRKHVKRDVADKIEHLYRDTVFKHRNEAFDILLLLSQKMQKIQAKTEKKTNSVINADLLESMNQTLSELEKLSQFFDQSQPTPVLVKMPESVVTKPTLVADTNILPSEFDPLSSDLDVNNTTIILDHIIDFMNTIIEDMRLWKKEPDPQQSNSSNVADHKIESINPPISTLVDTIEDNKLSDINQSVDSTNPVIADINLLPPVTEQKIAELVESSASDRPTDLTKSTMTAANAPSTILKPSILAEDNTIILANAIRKLLIQNIDTWKMKTTVALFMFGGSKIEHPDPNTTGHYIKVPHGIAKMIGIFKSNNSLISDITDSNEAKKILEALSRTALERLKLGSRSHTRFSETNQLYFLLAGLIPALNSSNMSTLKNINISQAKIDTGKITPDLIQQINSLLKQPDHLNTKKMKN